LKNSLIENVPSYRNVLINCNFKYSNTRRIFWQKVQN